MIFLMVFAFLTAWSGYAILSIIRLYGSGFSDYLIGLVMMLTKSGACLNIVIFILMHQEVIEKWCLDLNNELFLIFPLQFQKVLLPEWILDKYFSDIAEKKPEEVELEELAVKT